MGPRCLQRRDARVGRPASLPLHLPEHPLHLTGQLWEIYDNAARAVGYEPGPENRGYLLRVHVQDTEEKALECAREFMWDAGAVHRCRPPLLGQPVRIRVAERRLLYTKLANGLIPRINAASFEEQLASHEIVAGTPDQVIAALRVVLETCRPSILMLWGNDGKVGHPDAMRCIELTGQEVLRPCARWATSSASSIPSRSIRRSAWAYTPPDQLRASQGTPV